MSGSLECIEIRDFADFFFFAILVFGRFVAYVVGYTIDDVKSFYGLNANFAPCNEGCQSSLNTARRGNFVRLPARRA